MFLTGNKLKNIKTIDSNSVFIEDSVRIGFNVLIYPNNIIEGNSVIEDGVTLLPNNHIINSTVKKEAKISNSVLEEAIVEEKSVVGPFAHLRKGASIGKECKIGNFVEVKNSVLGSNVKASHLSYIGDCDIGEKVNVGCGVVFVNYTGKNKFRSEIGEGSFIGSSVNVIAPVKVGKRSYVCAGANIDSDVPENSFVIGRSRMTVKKDRAEKYLKGE